MSGESNGFEKAWQKAFEEAEIAPRQSNWEAINKALENKKSRTLVIFYRVSIAASVLIALSVAIYFGRQSSTQIEEPSELTDLAPLGLESPSDENLQQNIPEQPENESENQAIKVVTEHNGSESTAYEKSLEKKSDAALLSTNSDNPSSVNSSPGNTVTGFTEKDNSGENQLLTGGSAKASIANIDNLGLSDPDIRPSLAEIPDVNYGYDLLPDEDKENNEVVFLAGVNFSAGAFNQSSNSGGTTVENVAPRSSTNFNSQLSTLSAGVNSLGGQKELANYDLQVSENYTQSVAYSYGANFGFRLGKRVQIISGLDYTKAFSNQNRELGISQDGVVLANKFYDSNEAPGFAENTVYNGDVDTRSEFDFLSVPLKAGYLLVDKKFNLTLFTGISSEFLLQNSSDSGNEPPDYYRELADVESTDVYNSFYLNGIFSINAGYTIGQRYYIYVEPMYKRAITDFVSAGEGADRVPSFKMMMVGLSYQF